MSAPQSVNSRRPPQAKSIVSVATQVTQKLVDSGSSPKIAAATSTEAPSINADKEKLDVEQILSVPNYIYFEEHYPTESYTSLVDQRNQLREIKLSDLIEE